MTNGLSAWKSITWKFSTLGPENLEWLKLLWSQVAYNKQSTIWRLLQKMFIGLDIVERSCRAKYPFFTSLHFSGDTYILLDHLFRTTTSLDASNKSTYAAILSIAEPT